MKKMILSIACALLLLGCGSSYESTKQTKTNNVTKVITIANPQDYGNTITAADLKEDLFIYASDEFEGRETGKPGQKKAINFIKKHYQNLGIASPISNNDYYQEVPLEISKNPEATIIVNGKTFNHIEDFVSITPAKSNSFTANDIVFAGFGIEDDAYSDYKNLDINGKVVLIKSGEPKNDDGTYKISGTNDASKWSNMRQEFASKRTIALDKGAKALLFYSERAFNMMSQRMAKSSSGRLSLKDGKNSMYFFIINKELANSLLTNIDTENSAKKLNTSINLNFKSVSDQIISENVVAYIKGSEKPNEVVVISAHLDHEGIKNGEIYNGADDDGSGTVAVMEIAEAFQKAVKNGHTPKRTVVFLHVTGEEKGLLGSRYYTDVDPIFPLENTVVDLNIDMIGRTDPKRKEGKRNYIYLIGSDKLSVDLHNLSEAVNKDCCNIELDYTFNDDNDPNRFYYRSDHYNFAKNNIPVIFYFNGTHDDYHQPSDTPDKIEYDLLENRTRLVFYTAWEIANREQRIVVDKKTD
jgi:hypothetical protein